LPRGGWEASTLLSQREWGEKRARRIKREEARRRNRGGREREREREKDRDGERERQRGRKTEGERDRKREMEREREKRGRERGGGQRKRRKGRESKLSVDLASCVCSHTVDGGVWKHMGPLLSAPNGDCLPPPLYSLLLTLAGL